MLIIKLLKKQKLSPLKKCLRCYSRYLLRAPLVPSCGSIAAISKENAGEIPDVKMDKKYVNSKAVKEPKIDSDSKVCQLKIKAVKLRREKQRQ